MKNSKEENKGSDLIRLNKYIANSGVCSRRAADELIAKGVIKVNGKVITEVGTKVSPKDTVEYNGKKLQAETYRYVILNKPKDFITTMSDEKDRKTVMDLVGKACKERIYPVGRLDRNTTGLLLFTNDGELAKKLTHPSEKVKKIYKVNLNKKLEDVHKEEIIKGTHLEDGLMEVDQLEILNGAGTEIGVEIHSGRNRIIRRLFEFYGYEVIYLDRVVFANLTKKDLPRGNYRHLVKQEVSNLKHLKGYS